MCVISEVYTIKIRTQPIFFTWFSKTRSMPMSILNYKQHELVRYNLHVRRNLRDIQLALYNYKYNTKKMIYY